MPMLPEVRRMGRSWPALVANVASYSENIPKEGVALSVFVSDCLGHIHFDDREPVLRALRGKRVIYPVTVGLERRVYGKPVGRRLADPEAEPKVDQLVKAIGPTMMRIGALIDAGHGDPSDRDARALHREAASKMSGFISRHVARGASFPALRDALWLTFRHDALAILARYEGVLDRGSRVEAIKLPRPKLPRTPNGADPYERILALTDRSGQRGVTKGELREHFPKPRPSAAQLEAWITEIEDAQLIRHETMKLTKLGRPGVRYFHFNHESPRTVRGIAVFD